MEILLFLSISLIIILFSCIIFSNSVEWLGAKLNLSHGVTGSVLAAVGTALPETMVPLVAIFWGIDKETLIKVLTYGADKNSPLNEISMGAIIGAPFMLCTLAFCLVGVSSLIYFKSGRRKTKLINVDTSVLRRDLKFFIGAFLLSFIGIFLNHICRVILAVFLIVFYFLYIYKTFKEEGNSNYSGEELEENLEPLISSKIFRGAKPTMFLIVSQLVFSLLCLIFSAHHFVDAMKELSHLFNFPAFVISLLLAPLATELPEKFNSWIWIRGNKDTLAVGNISGALVFQSTFPVSIGLLFTSWSVSSVLTYYIFLFCIINALLVLISLNAGKLSYKTFLACGIFYLVYVILIYCLYLNTGMCVQCH